MSFNVSAAEQLDLFAYAATVRRKPPKGGWLKAPLSRQEQRQMGQMYVEHQGLIRLLGAKLTRQFPMVDSLDVFSCIDVAFLKSCRAFDPSKGKFSTILTKFATGEIRHFIRDHNFAITAPSKVRELSVPVRRLLSNGHSLDEVAQILGVSKQACKDAMVATAGIDHDIQGFELHECARPGPMDLLIAEEIAAS